MAQTRGSATRVHADALIVPHGSVRVWLVYWGSNPNMLRSPPFILDILFLFLRVGICSLEFVSYRTRGEA